MMIKHKVHLKSDNIICTAVIYINKIFKALCNDKNNQ